MTRHTPSNFTPGPWFVDQDGYSGAHPYTVALTGSYGPCIVAGEPTGGGSYPIGHEDVCRANARLIAASPDLLAACKALVEAVENHAPWDAMPMARAAIERAEKGTP